MTQIIINNINARALYLNTEPNTKPVTYEGRVVTLISP